MQQQTKSVAYSEILRLFSVAKKEKKDILASRYIQLALETAKKLSIKLPSELKRSYCHGCISLFRKGNFTTRLSKGRKIITCLKCKKIQRIPYR